MTDVASGAPESSDDLRLRRSDLQAIVDTSRQGDGALRTLVTIPTVNVAMPPLTVGTEGLTRAAIRESERHISWGQSSYGSVEASAFVLPNAVIHGPAGIIGWDGHVIAETLWHTEPDRHHYRTEGADIVLRSENATILPGRYVSILSGGAQNYFHSLIDGAARLSMLPNSVLAEADGLLIPADGVGQTELLGLYGLPPNLSLRAVSQRETLLVDELVLPWTLHHVFSYHPVINRFFDRVVERAGPSAHARPRRFYIDRRQSAMRKLLNEDDVVAVLDPFGIVPVRLETMSPAEQIDLFRGAEIVVAPHGAGLTSIGFAPKGCVVVELMMDAYLNWCFRRLAAVRGLAYGCVVGAARRPWADLNPAFHAQVWEISPADVRDAVTRVISAAGADAPQPV